MSMHAPSQSVAEHVMTTVFQLHLCEEMVDTVTLELAEADGLIPGAQDAAKREIFMVPGNAKMRNMPHKDFTFELVGVHDRNIRLAHVLSLHILCVAQYEVQRCDPGTEARKRCGNAMVMISRHFVQHALRQLVKVLSFAIILRTGCGHEKMRHDGGRGVQSSTRRAPTLSIPCPEEIPWDIVLPKGCRGHVRECSYTGSRRTSYLLIVPCARPRWVSLYGDLVSDYSPSFVSIGLTWVVTRCVQIPCGTACLFSQCVKLIETTRTILIYQLCSAPTGSQRHRKNCICKTKSQTTMCHTDSSGT